MCKFNRIICEIGNNLLDAQRIPHQLSRQIRRNVHDQFYISVFHSRSYDVYHIIDNIHRRILPHGYVHLSGLNFGKIQNIIDNTQQCLPRTLNLQDIFSCLRRKILPKRHIRHTDNRIHRRPDLMAHIRKKVGLHLRRCTNFLIGLQYLVLIAGNI